MSEERKKIIQAFGGETIFSPGGESLSGCLKKMSEITHQEPEKYFVANQFVNPRNPEIHYLQTAPETWEDLNGGVDIFVAGVGSGGSLQGIGKFLKERNPTVKIVAVEPKKQCRFAGQGTRSASDSRHW